MTARLPSAGEAGFTLVESLVAALILSVGILGTLGALGSGKRLTTVSQREQQALAYAQGAIEEASAVPFAQLALSGAPAAGGVTPPQSLVSACGTELCLTVRQHPQDPDSPGPDGGPPPLEPILTGGEVAATSALPDAAGTIYRYVTTPTRKCLETSTAPACGEQTKRVSVAVVLTRRTDGDGITTPVWISTLVANPAVTPLPVT